MNTESNPSDQSDVDNKPSVPVDQVSTPEVPQAQEGQAAATPSLPTFESINAEIVTSRVIDDRLARIKQTMAGNSSKTSAPTASESVGSVAPRKQGPPRKERDQAAPPRRPTRGVRPQDDEDSEKPRGPRSSFEKKERALPYPPPLTDRVPVPSIRQHDAQDIEAELAEMFQDEPLDELMKSADAVAGQEMFEDGTKVKGMVVSVLTDTVVMELGGREQGMLPLKQFPEGENPEIGKTIEVVVTRFNQADGVYEVSLPLAAADIGDWSSISTGMIVEAKVVAANKGGLDCEVGKLRAFLPISQIATFRVEDTSPFIGEKLKCIVTEASPQRRNLVLSRRALLEQEREELREKLWGELEVGQVREGLVRKIIDAGAFVDLGGLDGFIHISAMSWGRVNHPSEVMKEGDRVKVTVQRIDRDNNRISLSFKDESLDPWSTIQDRFQVNEQARGRVVTIMPFGAFVELMPGVEGLVHISEISYKHVTNVSDVLQVGDQVEVLILAIDDVKRKMSLSIKRLGADPKVEQAAKDEQARRDAIAAEEKKAEDEVEATRERIRKNQPKGPLKGGVSSSSDGEKFGLHW
ncbi:MAG: S1 RNA-binding domain-containing protein [Planctomycetia bacterium]|nr:S1 RNA-binding domain-containing protein [Planctomycetia bacterium]